MHRRAFIWAAGALNLAILVATSPEEYTVEDVSEPIAITLSPDQARVFLDVRVEAGEVVGSQSLEIAFEGVNHAPMLGAVDLYELPTDDRQLPPDSEPWESADIPMLPEGEQPVSFTLGPVPASGPIGIFHLMLELRGSAELEGEIVLSVSGSSIRDNKELWIEIQEVEVSP